MIKCEVCHGLFRRRVNRKNTSYSKYPSVSDIDGYLKEALEIWQRTYTKEAEKNVIVRNDLRQLEVKGVELELKHLNDKVIASIPTDYYSGLTYAVYASKEGCEECGKRLVTHVVQSDDLEESLKDPNRKPSYEYEEILVDEAGDSLVFYTNGEFDVDKIEASYYRKAIPPKCPALVEDKRSYIDNAGELVSENIDWEIDSTYIYNDVIDIAVWIFLRDVSDNIESDSQLKKIMTKYKLGV